MPKHTIYSLPFCMFTFLLFLGNIATQAVVLSSQTDDVSCRNVPGTAVLIGCLDFIRYDRPKTPPSESCCVGVRTIGMKCVCDIITKEIEEIINMKKLVYVAGACSRPLTAGSQCGSYKVPGP